MLFVYQWFLLLKKWTKVHTNFFYLILNLILSEPGIIFNLRLPVKTVDFHGEVTLYRFLTALETFLRHGS
jgi:hypothetical protein